MPGYNKYVCPSIPTFPTGCVALFVTRSLPQCVKSIAAVSDDSAEFVAVSVRFPKLTVTVVSGYVRPISRQKGSITRYLEEIRAACSGPLVICADFNGHNQLWGSKRASPRGREIAAAAEELELVIANDGSPTFFRPPATYSALDLTLHSTDIQLSWVVAPDTFGSDHFPIFITLPITGIQACHKVRRPVIHWDAFRKVFNPSSPHLEQEIKACIKASTKLCSVRESDRRRT